MIALLLAVVLSVVNNGADWRVQFAPDSANVGVNLVTECVNSTHHLIYRAVDFIQIDGDAHDAVSRRQDRLPAHSACSMTAEVLRNSSGAVGAPDEDYVGESAAINWTEP